jgi:hypothetical protein
MEKIRISFSDKESEITDTIKIGNKSVEVLTHISLPIQGILIQQYCEELTDITNPIEMRVLRANIKLYLSIINFMTNLEIEDIDDYSFPLDDIVANGTYDKILEKITNYRSFEKILNSSVELVFKDLYSKSNLGFKLESIIDKVEELLNKISGIDLDKDSIAKLMQTVLSTQKEFNDKYQIIEPSNDMIPVVENLIGSTENITKKVSVRRKKSE